MVIYIIQFNLDLLCPFINLVLKAFLLEYTPDDSCYYLNSYKSVRILKLSSSSSS